MKREIIPFSFASFINKVIVGARNIDLHIQLTADFQPYQGSTIPCRVRQNLGGVAYNVSSALRLLNNESVRLLTVSGSSLIPLMRTDSSVGIIEEIDGESTASYVSLLDSKTNELISGFGDMGIYERQMTPAFLDKYLPTFRSNAWIMFDANLSSSAMAHLVDIGTKYQKNLVFISAGGPTKARRIRPLLQHVHVVFCNRLEFEAMAGSTSSSIESSLDRLLKTNTNLKLICITLGADGVLIGIDGRLKRYQALSMEGEQHGIQNVTGAGDSFAAGVMDQLLKWNFDRIDRAIACGLLAAKFTLTSANTISEKLRTIDERMIDEACSKQLRYESIDP